MTTRVPVQPRMLEWALLRSGKSSEKVEKKFPKFQGWLKETEQPTLVQLEEFAKAVYVPFGYLFLSEPPKEELPIRDFRTVKNREVKQPSPDLLDTIYNCQERQSWYHEFAKAEEYDPVSFIGTATTAMAPEDVAKTIRATLDLNRATGSQYEALRSFILKAEKARILVMVSGIVQSNSHRKLDVKEFRGFALADDFAPLIFINGKDSKSARMFTLAHELAHLWLGTSGVSNTIAHPFSHSVPEEVWCNKVAAELLVPLADLRDCLQHIESIDETVVERLRKNFKVSGLVILCRLFDAGKLTRTNFDAAWNKELNLIRQKMAEKKAGSGGSFYNNMGSRMSKPFIRALVGSTLEGKTLYRDAFRMLGINNATTLKKMGRDLGMSI